jgi:hypothetical protein
MYTHITAFTLSISALKMSTQRDHMQRATDVNSREASENFTRCYVL